MMYRNACIAVDCSRCHQNQLVLSTETVVLLEHLHCGGGGGGGAFEWHQGAHNRQVMSPHCPLSHLVGLRERERIE